MERIATDTYSFERLRSSPERYVYVDKTALVRQLADGSYGTQFFVSRPRRFGKSLLITTLKALFEGRRELFAGLAIEPDWDWSRKWPVIHLDLGTVQSATVEEFRLSIQSLLESQSENLGVALRSGYGLADTFRMFIEDIAATSADGRCVVLVDEYDKPLLQHLGRADLARFRDELKPFYGVIKYCESKQRFALLTGVSKFSKVSVFSDLNNLTDITSDAAFSTLFGYTPAEISANFPEALKSLAEKNAMSETEALDEIRRWYDGYLFAEHGSRVINPISAGMCLKTAEFGSYWSMTAMTTFLMDELRRHPLDFSSVSIPAVSLDSYEPENPRMDVLLYQTGYLTIAEVVRAGHGPGKVGLPFVSLRFPNLEVEHSFVTRLAGVYSGASEEAAESAQSIAAAALEAGDVDRFFKAMDVFFRSIPYDLTDRQNEQMWQTIVYVVLRGVGLYCEAEVKTSDGRIDMVVKTAARIYIFEFKLDRPAAEALAQISEKRYVSPYLQCGKEIALVGIGFSSEKRTIVDRKVEFYKEVA